MDFLFGGDGLLTFVWDYINQWGSLFTGGVLIGVLTLIEQKTGKPFSWPIRRIFLIFFLFTAAFFSWRDQAHENIALQEKVKAENPNFIAHIDVINRFPSNDGPGTNLLSVISIANNGAPSFAEAWDTYAIIDGKEIRGERWLIRDKFTLQGVGGLQTFYKEDQASIKVAEDPIASGARKEVTLCGKFPGITPSQMDGVKVIIRFQDILGKKYEITGVAPHGLGDPALYSPGLRL